MVVSINPYKKLQIYGEDILNQYKEDVTDLPPHLYAVASKVTFLLFPQPHLLPGLYCPYTNERVPVGCYFRYDSLFLDLMLIFS